MYLLSLIFLSFSLMSLIKGEDDQVECIPDFCSKYGFRHIMCMSARGSDCDYYIKRDLQVGQAFTDEEKQFWLDTHNGIRKKLALGEEAKITNSDGAQAADVREMRWSRDLEVVARRWASQCLRKDSHWHAGTVRWVPGFETAERGVAQSFHFQYAWKYPNMTFEVINTTINEWYRPTVKSSDYPKPGENLTYHGRSSGIIDYVKMVWAETDQIGCAYTKWSSWYYLIICHYAPGVPNMYVANVDSGIMYKPGPPCSECPDGTTCKDNLCALITDEEAGDDGEEGGEMENGEGMIIHKWNQEQHHTCTCKCATVGKNCTDTADNESTDCLN